MTTPTPLPCPFCSHPEPTVMHDGPGVTVGYCAFWVWCEACNATGPEENTEEADAVAAWNRAPRESPRDHLAERLRNARRRGRRVLARRRSR